jgi:hypothetical protein
MAHVLVQHLETELDWAQDKPADVMNGYGTAGNVANGGFQEVAPFGGYGWRYYTNTGVSREKDDPHSNQFFLRLDDGASVHHIWTTPLESYTKTFGLTDEWSEIEITCS